MAFDHLHYQYEPPALWSVRGIGAELQGRFDDLEMAPVFYQRWVFTVFNIPVWFGRIYATEPLGAGRGQRTLGWISGREFAARYGRRAYWSFHARLMALPLLLWLAFLVLVGWTFVANSRDHLAEPRPEAVSTPVADRGSGSAR